MPGTLRTLTPDQAVELAQLNMQANHQLKITAYLGQVDVPRSFAQVGGGGVTRPDGLTFSQWSNERGELLLMVSGLGLFTYQLDYARQTAGDGGNDPHSNDSADWLPEYPEAGEDDNQDSEEYPEYPQDEQRDDY